VSPDEDARTRFCIGEYPRLVGALTLYTGERELAVELAQEALARACRHWRRVERMAAPGAWVHRVAINLANSTFARRRAERRVRERLVGLAEPGGAEITGAERLEVRAAVAQLPVRQRAAIVLRYFVDLPVREVADVMGIKEGTVKALTHQAVVNLRRALDMGELREVSHGE
jgi:RNA polymerase sigma factor (sigma-70 family)